MHVRLHDGPETLSELATAGTSCKTLQVVTWPVTLLLLSDKGHDCS